MHTEEASVRHPAEAELLLSSPQPDTKQRSRQHTIIFWKLCTAAFFVDLALQILQPAQTQILESIYCAQWYEQHPASGVPLHGHIPESYCKIGPVQTQVSSLKGWLEVALSAPGLLMSIPIGMLSDAVGRRYLFIVNVLTLFLGEAWITFVCWFGGQMPLYTTLLAGSLGLLTGGTIVTEMLFVCCLTDVSPGEQLTKSFFRATAFGQFSKVVGPLIAGALMKVDAWFAVYAGLACLGIMVMMITTIPETLRSKEHTEYTRTATAAQDVKPTYRRRLLLASSSQSVQQVLKIWSDWRLVFVALMYPFKMVHFALDDLIQRYVSDRYGWTLADATLLYSIQAISTTLMLLVILPIISDQIDHWYSLSVLQRNVVLTRTSVAILALAYLAIGFAPNIPIMVIGLFVETLATGLPSAMRALAAALVAHEDKGRVYSVLAVAEALSAIIAYPVTAQLFNIGLAKGGGAWLGLPYDVIALGGAVVFAVMCLLRFERRMRV
ncbi:major facilitator superfamily domain-containing protein [Exophiala viscosa]|uniref:Major facilitator superfamily domain-containing protein n=1 Tax=Exophiala viscosa TaxID=2486360 RepID=A0AAN6E3U2_9EURO|nr:major facilitator superfamily domain-containing protein [Exophiala viscosa]